MRNLLAGLALALLIASPVAAKHGGSCSVEDVIVGDYAQIRATGLDRSRLYSFALHWSGASAYSFAAYPNPDGSLAWGAYVYGVGPATGEVRSAKFTASCDFEVQP